MKTIKNIDKHDINYPYNGFTYSLPKEKAVSVSEELYLFLEERLPLSFDFNYNLKKGEVVPPVKKVKTRAFIPSEEQVQDLGTEDMRIMPVHPKPTFGNPEDIPNGVDADGVGWYGEGVQVEGGAE